MIRYDKKLKSEIQRIVNNYNAKIRRLENKNDESIYLPEKINKKTLEAMKGSVTTRKDLRRMLKTYQDFTMRGGEQNINYKGHTLPKFKVKELRRYQNIVKRKIQKEEEFYKKERLATFGQEEDLTLKEQFSTEYQNLIARKEKLLDVNIDKMNIEEIESYILKLQSNSKDDNLKEWQKRFVEEIMEHVGYLYGVDSDKIKKLQNKLMSLSPSKFYEMYKKENALRQIIYGYKEIKDLGIDILLGDVETTTLSTFNELYKNIDEMVEEYK